MTPKESKDEPNIVIPRMNYVSEYPFRFFKLNLISIFELTIAGYNQANHTTDNITNLVCYGYFHWLFNPECQHIFGKQTGYICTFSVIF
jgi:hypothetical protein